jgi:hypothetical protein
MAPAYSPKTKRPKRDPRTARIARDRPDILGRMKAGEYSSVRQAAIDAGIIRRTPPPEDRRLEDPIKAWHHAALEDRQCFLSLCAQEIDAAANGEYLQPKVVTGRMLPYTAAEKGIPLQKLRG